MSEMAERPAWAGEHDVIVDLVISGATYKVPPTVKAAYENTPTRRGGGEEDEEEDGESLLFAVPSGFKLLDHPSNLPTKIDGLFILLLFNTGWNLVKFTEYKPRATKFKYIITYTEGSRPTQLKLEDYYDGDKEPVVPHTAGDAGLWVLMQKQSRGGADMED